MYKIAWDNETGGVLLYIEDTLDVSPCPVSWGKLDLLKLYEQVRVDNVELDKFGIDSDCSISFT